MDRDTVEAVQLRAPARSPVDREYLQALVKDSSILTFVVDVDVKERILNNFLHFDSLIPSMRSLGQDLKVLRMHAKVLTCLFGDSEESLRSRLQQSFKGTNQRPGYFRVQKSEFVLHEHEGGLDAQLHFGIAQLWLFAGRHFLIPSRTEQDDSKQLPRKGNPVIWHRFATLAYQLGFESPRIHELLSEDPEEKSAGAVLLEARPAPDFEYDPQQFGRFKKQIAHMFAQAREVSGSEDSNQFVLNRDGESLQRRCGRSAFQNSFESNGRHLFLRSFFEQNEAIDQGLSSLFVALSVYKAFLGDLLQLDTVGRQGALADLGTSAGLIVPSFSARIREESVGFETEETRTRTEVGERDLTAPPLDSDTQDELSSNVNSRWTAQVTAAKVEVERLERQLQVQKRCNEELVEQAIDGQTRERLLQAQVQDLETRLVRCEELKEQWLADRLQEATAGLEEERMGLQKAEQRIETAEAELERALYNLNSVTSERDRLFEISEERSAQINALEQQHTESHAKLDRVGTQATEAANLSEEITALKSENEDLKMQLKSQGIKLERSYHTIEELHATEIRMESSLKAELNIKHQKHHEELSKIRSDAMDTKQQSDSRIQELESQLLGRENQRQHVQQSSQDPPQRSRNIGPQDGVDIHFEFREEDGSRVRKRTQKMSSAELKRVLQKGQRKGVYPMTRTGRALDPETAWDDVVNDGSHTIIEARMSKAAFLDDASPLPTAPAGHVTTTAKVRGQGASNLQLVGREIRPSGKTLQSQKAITDLDSQRGRTAYSSAQLGDFRPNRRGEPSFAKGSQQLAKEQRP